MLLCAQRLRRVVLCFDRIRQGVAKQATKRETHLAVVSCTSNGRDGFGTKQDSTEQSSDRSVMRVRLESSCNVSWLGGGDLDQSRR